MSDKKRIVIATPGQLGSNPRVVKEAQALHDAGFDVTVVATRVSGFVEPRDQSVLEKAPYRVIRVSFTNRLVRAAGRTTHAVAGLVLRLTKSHTAADLASSFMTARLAAATRSVPGDLYIAHYTAALPAAAAAARRNRALYAFDAEDFHLGDQPDAPEHAIEKEIIRSVERRYLPGAAYVTAGSPMIAEEYATTYGIQLPTTILNVFPKKNAPPAPSPRGSAHPHPSLYWFSQTIGPGRGLETAVEAIARSESRTHLYLRGTPTGDYVQHLMKLALRGGVAEFVHLLEPAAPDQLETLGAAYDLGYIGEVGETRNRQIALTNKLFSYLLGGVPGVASDVPAHRRIAAQLGPAMALFSAADAGALASSIDSYLLNPAILSAARHHAWAVSQERLNWDMESKTLVTLVEQALQA